MKRFTLAAVRSLNLNYNELKADVYGRYLDTQYLRRQGEPGITKKDIEAIYFLYNCLKATTSCWSSDWNLYFFEGVTQDRDVSEAVRSMAKKQFLSIVAGYPTTSLAQ
jgi:hypothetical protein